jgi:hypothetical protein
MSYVVFVLKQGNEGGVSLEAFLEFPTLSQVLAHLMA